MKNVDSCHANTLVYCDHHCAYYFSALLIATMSAKSLGTRPVIYAAEELQNLLPLKAMPVNFQK